MIAERDLQIKASYARHSQHAIVLAEFSLETWGFLFFPVPESSAKNPGKSGRAWIAGMVP